MAVQDKRSWSARDSAGEAAADPGTPGDPVVASEADAEIGLRAQLEEREARYTEILNRWTRTQADFANFRRRSEQDARELLNFANQAFAFEVLRIADGLERAFETIPADLRNFSWIDGLRLIHAQLLGILQSQGVQPIECRTGDAVDIEKHQVVMADQEHESPVIVEEMQRGYSMRERVLRPALVRVGPLPTADTTIASGGSVTAPTADGTEEE